MLITAVQLTISIHALRGEGDDFVVCLYFADGVFQSTPSVGRATICGVDLCEYEDISIHALRGEGDGCEITDYCTYDNFNPRPPWGGRQRNRAGSHGGSRFQSTPSVGRATFSRLQFVASSRISIHALRGEGDAQPESVIFGLTAFQSTPSVGRATLRGCALQSTAKISIHALRGEGDSHALITCVTKSFISIHALRGEGDRLFAVPYRRLPYFNPRPPWGGRPSSILQL